MFEKRWTWLQKLSVRPQNRLFLRVKPNKSKDLQVSETQPVRLEAGIFGDCESVGDGVFELREHLGAGYRVYFGRHGRLLVVLLCGGEKKTQARDIEAAKSYWADWKRRQQ